MQGSEELNSWREELASLVEDTGIPFTGDGIGILTPGSTTTEPPLFESVETEATSSVESESIKDQINGFAKAWAELMAELGRGCKDVVQQTLLTEDSYIVKKTKEPLNQVTEKLRFLNEFLPEDRDPVQAWSVIFFVFILALAALTENEYYSNLQTVKKVHIHPPSALRVLLPDGRYMAYREVGVPADKARFSLVTPHGFLSSRLAGIPGVKVSLLEEYGVRLITYDLPGFGESDPHPNRNLSSSALDMSYLAEAVGVKGKFWVLGYSSGSMHAWAALKYIPNRVAGAAMFAPWINPYESSMSKEERSGTWKNWTRKRKFLYYLARRFPKFLGYLYRQTFLSGKHGQINKWLSLSLGKKDTTLVKTSDFEEFWHRDVEESIRQGKTKPFIEEAVIQVSNWGFSLVDLQVQRKCQRKGIFPWLQFIYGEAECELTGFLGPIHIWQVGRCFCFFFNDLLSRSEKGKLR
ncbi:Alpha beta-Hydrolases superfamily isoform 2 [Olea europaea subsp. europaea]|uniref:Alpha beta-Hydrolases superfamily isoform 2 n=1 Tax=Olea europaea subsp. europaea TaxID=158383 RepID=A0A8S0THV6_OLEEU|nr:Alpha beta-Hydrolases superfamily isoform 2 [Olea europaea subsp. europaea]